MNIAIVLSGGTGTRMGLSTPKQYVEVGGKPIIGYSLLTLQYSDFVDAIIVVCHPDWKCFIMSLVKQIGIEKLIATAPSGESRQESVLNGLRACKPYAKDTDVVLIHDAARPLVSESMLADLVKLDGLEGKMPVLPVKDTVYYSEDGTTISELLIRDKVFAGQAPESFLFGKYLAVNESVSADEITRTRGSSEIAFRHGMKIGLVPGEESNYKITTPSDLEKFKTETEGR